MSYLPTLFADRRLLLFLLSGFLAFALGFVVISDGQSMQLMIYGGYWAILLITALFVWNLITLVRNDWSGWASIRSVPRWPAAVILGCTGILLVHETYGFKILMDEVMLLGTSMSMHFEKMSLVPMRGNDIQGAFQILGGELDKRPLFQPFLVSLLHDFTGYRPENVFVLNTILTFLLLTLTYLTGLRIAGRSAGMLAVLLLTSLPLLAQNAKGGGFEILNLVMILSVLLLGMRYAARRDGSSLNVFFLSAVLLAQTRYESVVFLFPVGLLILWVWWQEQKLALTLTLALGPLLLVPYALHNRIFSARSSSWEMASQSGYDRPFAFSYIPDNIAHDLNFFFSTNGEHSNSLAISILGFIALPFFILWVYKTLSSSRTAQPAKVALAIFALGLVAHALLLLCYFWGRFDDPVIRRLSLPFNLTLVVATVVVAAEMNLRGKVWPILATLASFGIFAQSLPAMARHNYSAEYYYGAEMEWRRQFIAEHPEKDYLVIDNSAIIWVTHLVSATTMKQARDRKENIIFNQRNRIFSAIYAFQRFDVDPDNGRLTLHSQIETKDDDLGPDYQLETVWEKRFTPLTVTRISRVISIREGPTTAPIRTPSSLEKLAPEEREKIRQAYLDNFIKRLP
jgi:Dolichyl-phosphate-mannose-protein mannosyltransferase